MQDPTVRVRFAPSPTGFLHIGGLRTALYNYLFARRFGGTFVLRIEDTDRKRFVEEAESDILRSLEWAGLGFDEGPGFSGPFGPYRQSERKELYTRHAESLIESGAAYYAFDTENEIEALRQRYRDKGVDAVAYGVQTRDEMKNSLTLSSPKVEEMLSRGTPFVIRLRVPSDDEISFVDMVRGPVTFSSAQLDDQVLVKSDGLPTYHLANVVDDHLMGITHVIRGEEWLPSTPKHILLYQSFGWEPPIMAHLPLILSPNGGKLSKRNADKMGIPVSVQQYIEDGYEAEALVNFLALLGWHPEDDRELFPLADLVDAFDISRVGSSGVQFSLDKLKWFNEQHLRAQAPSEIARRASVVVRSRGFTFDAAYLAGVADLVRDRISFAHEIADFVYLFEDPASFDAKTIAKRWKGEAPAHIQSIGTELRNSPAASWKSDVLHDIVASIMESFGLSIGKIMPQLRLAVSGSASGPDLFPMLELLGQETVCRRLAAAPGLISATLTPEST